MDSVATRVNGSNSGKNRPFGKVERQIARRYLGAKKSEGGVAVIAVISFICIMLAIWAMIVIMSIMNGFRAKLIEFTVGSEGHMYVNFFIPPTPETITELENRLTAHPKVERAFEFSESFAGVLANEQLVIGRVIGIAPERLREFSMISDNLQHGSLAGFGQGRGSNHQIAIGQQMANQLGLTAGDRVRILTSKSRPSAVGPPTPISKVYTIGAIFEVGIYTSDLTNIYMDLEQSQLLFNGGKSNGNIQIRLINTDDIHKMKEPVQEMAGEPVNMLTWEDRNERTATALQTEKVAMSLIFVIVVIIAIFPVLAAMIMLVKNKSRDIAILRTIGGTRSTILRIFFIAGATIGILGTLAGLFMGILFCLNIGAVQSFIEWIIQRPLFPYDVYKVKTGIPVKVVWGEVVFVALVGFIISALATLFPAISAANTDPVEALRYD